MASAFSHAFVALAIGYLRPWKVWPARFWTLSIVCSIIPDGDVVGFAIGIPYEHVLGHRGLTHSLAFAVIVGWLVVRVAFSEIPSGSREWWWLVIHFSLVTVSHGLLDAMTDGGLGIAFFAPFDNGRYFLPWTPIKVSPIGIAGFFTDYGLQVLRSELVWIGIPVGLWILGITVYRRKRCGSAGDV